MDLPWARPTASDQQSSSPGVIAEKLGMGAQRPCNGALPKALRVGIPIDLAWAVTFPSHLTIIVLFTAAAGVGGCGSGDRSDVHRWAESRGGTLMGIHHDRAQAALAPLTGCGAIQRPVTVAVLDSDDAGAYCWRSGAIYVTRGLLEALEDDELTAAIAHEVGHLLVDGHMPRTAALDGCRTACGVGGQEDSEIAADRMGRELLRVAGVREGALTDLLRKLATQPANTPNCRDHLGHRIAALDASRAGANQ